MANRLILVLPLLFLLEGCTHHLFFAEESHLALKAKFRTDSTAPFDVGLGYRRGMIALLPKQSDAGAGVQTPSACGGTKPEADVLRVCYDPDELMSLYTIFKANIGFNEPVEVCHFMATGGAATALLANEESLQALVKAIGGYSSADNP